MTLTQKFELFLACLAFVIFMNWYRGRGKRAADKKDRELMAQLDALGYKRED